MPDPKEADAKRAYPLSQSAGVSGIRASGGYVREEFLTTLVGEKGYKVFREMAANDSTCHAILFATKMLLRSASWNVEPASEEADAIEAADIVEGMLFRDMEMGWPDVVDSACSMFTYGFSILEAVFKKRNGPNVAKPWLASDYEDGLWGLQGLFNRAQETIPRWIIDDEEHLLGFEQWPYDGPMRTVPISRCLHFRTTTERGNPEGVSLLRGAYRSWSFLKKMQEIEGVGMERDLAGYPVMRVPAALLSPNASPEEVAAKQGFEQFLKDVRRDTQEGVLLPSDTREDGSAYYDFELMSSGGTRAIPIDATINRYQRDIARSILADFLFLGSDGAGSLALGQTKVQTFVIAMTGYIESFATQFNEKLIPLIWRVNGLDPELMPKLIAEDLEPEDLAGVAAYITALAKVGYDLASDTELENTLRRKGGLPDAPDRDDEGVYDPNLTPEEEQAAVSATSAKLTAQTSAAARAAAEEQYGADDPEAEEKSKESLAKWFAKAMEGFDAR